jgi:salicylate hydroxylase
MGPEKHCVFYPIRGGKEYNLVLLRPDNLPSDVRTVNGDIDEMKESFRGWDPL